MDTTLEELWDVYQRLQSYCQNSGQQLDFLKGIKLGVSTVYNLSDLDKRLQIQNARLDEARAAREEEFRKFTEYDARMPTDQQFAAAQREIEELEDQKNAFARSIASDMSKLQQKEMLEELKRHSKQRIELIDKEIEIEEQLAKARLQVKGEPAKRTVWDEKIAELNYFKEGMM